MLISNVENLTKGSEKRVKVKCDMCQKITETSYSNYYNSQKNRGWPGTTFCRSCVCAISANKRRGRPAHNKGKKLDSSQKGLNHPSWKGGKYISSDGYVMINIGLEEFKKSKWENYRKEHIVIVEKNIGRKLTSDEVVHHIDGNKLNNDVKNLFLTTSKGHRNAHCSLQEIGYLLYKNGIIGFDEISGKYFLEIENESSKCP